MRGMYSPTSLLFVRIDSRLRYSGLSLFWDKPFEELFKNVDKTPEYERRRVVSRNRR